MSRNSGYSGTTSFQFEIERYKSKTGELVEDTQIPADSEESDYEYQTFTLEVSGRSYYQPGRFSGPPEDCYPDEGETEILSVIGPDGKDWQDKLSDSENDSIIQMITDNVSSGSDRDYDDYYDDSESYDYLDY